eukprot:752061-Hanusia_phi.AAC.2
MRRRGGGGGGGGGGGERGEKREIWDEWQHERDAGWEERLPGPVRVSRSSLVLRVRPPLWHRIHRLLLREEEGVHQQ